MPSPHRGLRHLPWFQFIADHDDGSEMRRIVEPGFFLVRLVDHFVLAGPVMIAPESVSVASVRRLIGEMPAGHAHRPLILSVLNQLQQRTDGDVRSVLPALRLYARALEQEPWGRTLACDVQATVREYAR